jgi:hypothetical protein
VANSSELDSVAVAAKDDFTRANATAESRDVAKSFMALEELVVRICWRRWVCTTFPSHFILKKGPGVSLYAKKL